MAGAEAQPRLTGYQRGSEEFSRLLAFSDAVFAIAMTLLVVGITAPTLSDGSDVGELADALNDLTSNFVSFFISFAVIGRYWAAHHQFYAGLARIDRRMIGINLVYLAFIAFLPFPTVLLGTYFENPLSVSVYAVTVGIVSGLEVVLFRHAHHARLFTRTMPDDVYRWGVILSLSPVVFFIASVPLAFLNTVVAVAFWFLVVPLGAITGRWKPRAADDFFAP
jgi:uncharacterized membrane protein